MNPGPVDLHGLGWYSEPSCPSSRPRRLRNLRGNSCAIELFSLVRSTWLVGVLYGNPIWELLFAEVRESSSLLVAGLGLGGPEACRGPGCLSRAAPGACRGPGGSSRAGLAARCGLGGSLQAWSPGACRGPLLGLVAGLAARRWRLAARRGFLAARRGLLALVVGLAARGEAGWGQRVGVARWGSATGQRMFKVQFNT